MNLTLVNAYIPEYGPANRFNHEPRRPRRLLLHRRQIDRLLGAVRREGRTIVPTRLYFNDRGLAKLELALAKGKTAPDKRRAEADRDWKREQGRLFAIAGSAPLVRRRSDPERARRLCYDWLGFHDQADIENTCHPRPTRDWSWGFLCSGRVNSPRPTASIKPFSDVTPITPARCICQAL